MKGLTSNTGGHESVAPQEIQVVCLGPEAFSSYLENNKYTFSLLLGKICCSVSSKHCWVKISTIHVLIPHGTWTAWFILPQLQVTFTFDIDNTVCAKLCPQPNKANNA